jgi:hypothetical protein
VHVSVGLKRERNRAGTSHDGVSRIPAIPGVPRSGGGLDAVLPSESELLPWLEMITPQPDLDGEPPVVRMQVEWELVFGVGV